VRNLETFSCAVAAAAELFLPLPLLLLRHVAAPGTCA
jgi:hypothetical protein